MKSSLYDHSNHLCTAKQALVLATGVRPTGYAGGAALATVGLAAVDAHAYVNHHKPVMILQSSFLD